MSIQSFISAAQKLYETNYYNESLSLVCIAVDATAALKYPSLKVTERYKKFLSNNFRVICRKGFPGITADSIRIKVHKDIKSLEPDHEGYVDIPQIIYHVLRCGLVHDCEIEKTLVFTNCTLIADWKEDKFYLPRSLILGLIDAINEQEHDSLLCI